MGTETVGNLLTEAAMLMLVGMVFVFAFLGLMIIGVMLIARFSQRFPGPQAPPPRINKKSKIAPASSSEGPNAHVVAAISAAVHKHRRQTHKI